MTIEATAFPTGTKASIPLVVKPAATITAPASSATYGDQYSYQVNVAGDAGPPTGTVTLSKGATKLDEQELSAGSASFTVDTTALGAGDSELTVTYQGDAGFAPAVAKPTFSIAKAGTTVQADDPEPTPYDGTIEVDSTVASDTGTNPTGSLKVSEGSTELGTVSLDNSSSGTVDIDASTLTIGGHVLTVDYAGDANHAASTTTVDVTVSKGTAELIATTDPST